MNRTVKAMDHQPANAFITARKGFLLSEHQVLVRNHEMMRIRAYKIDPDEKRHMRRLYLDVTFDWKKITQQLATKREACRRCYRTRPKKAAGRNGSRDGGPLFGIYEPGTRTVYTNGIPSTAAGVGRLLDAILQLDRERTGAPLVEPARRPAEPGLVPARRGKPLKSR